MVAVAQSRSVSSSLSSGTVPAGSSSSRQLLRRTAHLAAVQIAIPAKEDQIPAKVDQTRRRQTALTMGATEPARSL